MADKDDDKTVVEETVEKPEDTKPVDDAPPPVDKPEHNESDLRGIVNALTEQVKELEGKVSAIVESGGERDSIPGGRRPWTHRRMF